MAIINCKECKKEISDKAESCPHCGFKPSQAYKPSGCFIVIIAALLILLIVGIMPSNNNETKKNTDNESSDPSESAGAACMEFIKRTLHDPSSAEFEHSSKTNIYNESGNIYIVTRAVRAKNGFNAMRNYQYHCKMTIEADGWHALSVKEIK